MDKSSKNIVVIAAVLAAITIALGAFGAHGLKSIVSAESLTTFETGVRYQMYHVIALLVIGLSAQVPVATKKWVLRFFLLRNALLFGFYLSTCTKRAAVFFCLFLGSNNANRRTPLYSRLDTLSIRVINI